MANKVTSKKPGKTGMGLVVGYKHQTGAASGNHSTIKQILSPEEKYFLDLLADSFIKKSNNGEALKQ